jgi:hypothetical protein
MIFKRKSKMFWVEAILYAAIIITCILGSFGVFDAKAQEPVAVDECAEWVKIPSLFRIQILRYGMITELITANLQEGTEGLVDCLSEHEHMMLLDESIVAECRRGGNEQELADVFERSLERIVFKCLKWVNEAEDFEIDGKAQGAEGIE